MTFRWWIFIKEENNIHDNEKVKFNNGKDDLKKKKLHSEVDKQQ